VAEVIGQALCDEGAAVDVRLAKEVHDVSAYRAVILGSAIRMGRWLPEAVEFVETHQDTLRQLPVAYFSVCMTLQEDTEENRREVAAYVDPVREIVQPVDVGAFAGAMDYGKLSLAFQLLIRAMKIPEGDFRNWDSIHTWGTDVRPMLLNGSRSRFAPAGLPNPAEGGGLPNPPRAFHDLLNV
jgi:menaquinone-dependent protoporphyrinogen oxidase